MNNGQDVESALAYDCRIAWAWRRECPKAIFDLAERCIVTDPRASEHTEEDMRMVQTGAAVFFSLAALFMVGASEAGEISVMSTVAVREPYVELAPVFERMTGNKVATTWVGAGAIIQRIKGGEIVDLAITTASGIDELNKL